MISGLRKAGAAVVAQRLSPLALFTFAAVAGLVFLRHETSDYVRFLNPWMAEIHARGWRSIAGDFANYTPPYIYLMNLVSGLTSTLGNPAAIKLINIPFIVAAALGAYRLARLVSDAQGARLAASAVAAAPTMLVNSFVWGQCDVIYTSILLWSLYFILSGRAGAGCFAFGVALAFKLQTVFLGPVMLFFLVTRKINVAHAALVLAAYALMMTPAWIAGRSIEDLLLIYAGQADFYDRLSMNAPNVWYLADRFGVDYRVGVMLGLGLTVLAALALSFWAVSKRLDIVGALLLAATSATLMPYILPKMHDRYMFLADVLLLVLAFVRPRLWWVAALGQLGSLAAYGGYFGADRYLNGFQTPLIGVVAYGVVAFALTWQLLRYPGSAVAPLSAGRAP